MLHQFASDRSGNFAIIAAVMLMPLVAGVALAVDYTMASTKRAEMHNATDGAALALARAGNNLSTMQAYAIAENFIRANYDGGFSGFDISKDGETWTVSMTANADMRFAGVLGLGSSAIDVVSSATYALKTYEIGLVLDTTGSMEGEKLEKLKAAATTLVDTLAAEIPDPGSLRFALVPFSAFVNVGPQFGPQFDPEGDLAEPGAEWLDLRGESPVRQSELEEGLSRFELFHHLGEEWRGCVETRDPYGSHRYDVTDLAADPDEKRSLFVPALSIDEPDKENRWGQPRYPNSYLGDGGASLEDEKQERLRKKYNIEMNPGADDGGGLLGGLVGGLLGGVVGVLSDALFGQAPEIDDSPSRFYSNFSDPKGPNFDCASQPIVALSSDYGLIKENIEALSAKGATNMMEGVMWGWRVLSPGEPFAEGRGKDDGDNEKIMIFLSDGANSWTQLPNELGSAYSSFGYVVDDRLIGPGAGMVAVTNALDDKTLTGCANAKHDGLTIYTVRLELQDAGTDALLRDCATSEGRYFDVPDASQLQKTFQAIGQRIRQVRISS